MSLAPETIVNILSFLKLDFDIISTLMNISKDFRYITELFSYGKQRSSTITFVGPSRVGKTSSMAHLLSKLGYLSPEKIEENITQGMDLSKVEDKSFTVTDEEFENYCSFALAFDRSKDEREQNKTVHNKRISFGKNKNYSYTFIDTSGSYHKNPIRGIAMADVCVMFIPAPVELYKRSLKEIKNTILEMKLTRKTPLFVINQMDKVQFLEEAYNDIVNDLKENLKKMGLYSKAIFIPISGFVGENLILNRKMTWYRGPTLYDAILHETHDYRYNSGKTVLDLYFKNELPKLNFGTFRFSTIKTYQVKEETIATGKVISGVINEGDEVVIEPEGIFSKVKSIEMNHKSVTQAFSGDQVSLCLLSPMTHISRGSIIGSRKESYPSQVEYFKAHILALEDFSNKSMPVLFLHNSFVNCNISFIHLLDKKTKQEIKIGKPTKVKRNDYFLAEVSALGPISIETKDNHPSFALSKFILKSNENRILAFGEVVSTTPKSKVILNQIGIKNKKKIEVKKKEVKKTVEVEDLGVWSAFKFNKNDWNSC